MANDSLLPTHWIRDLERIFEVLQCNNADKIRCAMFQFQGDANAWWHSSKENFWATHLNATWAQFTEIFLENYFPRNFHDKKEAEFMSLIQGSRVVLDYQQMFEELFYFVPEHLKLEYVKARRFEKGLKPNIDTTVVLHEYPTYV
ncbi:uncharacterized protein LOC122643495 [Telopea speciosissima]|uniref:uncharacterized protein LOC122643495 n=1 Tax=Telopea speciosissima TaxID=54955 RepID=UPI001CC5B5EB|nr:uncharacterized protein LOC122643495 [Telopea speciosissima]